MSFWQMTSERQMALYKENEWFKSWKRKYQQIQKQLFTIALLTTSSVDSRKLLQFATSPFHRKT